MKLYLCTTIGGTRYIGEWFNTCMKLSPSKMVIARDISRSEVLPENLHVYVIDYDTGLKWKSYEERHAGWDSDKSILKGLILLLEDAMSTDATHFLHIDSDVILSDNAVKYILEHDWDYLQIETPVIPRELSQIELSRWRKHVMCFSESTNFGVSRKLFTAILSDLKSIQSPYPVDINLHKIVKKHFHKLPTGAFAKVSCKSVAHYIMGEKVVV